MKMTKGTAAYTIMRQVKKFESLIEETINDIKRGYYHWERTWRAIEEVGESLQECLKMAAVRNAQGWLTDHQYAYIAGRLQKLSSKLGSAAAAYFVQQAEEGKNPILPNKLLA